MKNSLLRTLLSKHAFYSDTDRNFNPTPLDDFKICSPRVLERHNRHMPPRNDRNRSAERQKALLQYRCDVEHNLLTTATSAFSAIDRSTIRNDSLFVRTNEHLNYQRLTYERLLWGQIPPSMSGSSSQSCKNRSEARGRDPRFDSSTHERSTWGKDESRGQHAIIPRSTTIFYQPPERTMQGSSRTTKWTTSQDTTAAAHCMANEPS